MSSSISYLNGAWLPPEEATVSVLDRGFMFGDGVYEVLPVYHGKPFAVTEHLRRLANSLAEVRITPPMTDEEWRRLIALGVDKCGTSFATVYIQVTRGVAGQRAHEFPESAPTVFLIITEAPKLERRNVKPLSMITLDDYRWDKGHIKSTSLLANALLRNEAIARGADDAILIRAGYVTEATSSNVFVVNKGVIATPARSNHLLHGITRNYIIKLARGAGLAVEERDVSLEELRLADEIWVTSTGQEVWPVGKLNGHVVGSGERGVLWQQVDSLFQQLKSSFVSTDSDRS